MSQHLDALQQANQVRSASAATRRQLREMSYHEGCEQVAGWLLDDPLPEIEATRLVHLLTSIRRCGETMALKAMRRVGIPQTRLNHLIRVRDLTDRERVALADDLRGRRCEEPVLGGFQQLLPVTEEGGRR